MNTLFPKIICRCKQKKSIRHIQHTPQRIKIAKMTDSILLLHIQSFPILCKKGVLILDQKAANTLTRSHQNRQKILLYIQKLIVKDVDHKTNETQITPIQLL